MPTMSEQEAWALGLRIARTTTRYTPMAEAADYASAAALALLACEVPPGVDRDAYLWSVGRYAIIDEYRRTHGRKGDRHPQTLPLEETGRAERAERILHHQTPQAVRERLEAELAVLPTPISARQRQVWQLLSEGYTSIEAAERLGISRETVRTHVRSTLVKLGARTRVQAVAMLVARGEVIARKA